MDNKTLLLFTLIAILPTSLDAISPYCEIKSCQNGSHTLCRFPEPGMSSQCGIAIGFGLDNFEKNRIVQLHNNLRHRVYSGEEFRGNPGPLPRAERFTYLQWDDELALAAQRWAEQCILTSDICRDVGRFHVGQSIGFETTFGNVEQLTVDLVVRKWYDQVERFSKYSINHFSNYFANRTRTTNFSQIIWSSTLKIGCGAIRYFDSIINTFLLVCNYGRRGNISQSPVYSVLRNRV